MPKPTRTLFTLLLALSLLGGWTVHAATSCEGPCCATEVPVPRAMGHGGAATERAASGCCCCGKEAVPCDLERSQVPEEQPRALTAAPKVRTLTVGLLAVSHSLPVVQNPVAVALRSATGPPGWSPPDPLYLHHLSFLC